MVAAKEIRRDIGINICHQRADASLVPLNFWSEIVFVVGVADSGVIIGRGISLGRENVSLLRRDRWLSHRSILGWHGFKEHG